MSNRRPSKSSKNQSSRGQSSRNDSRRTRSYDRYPTEWSKWTWDKEVDRYRSSRETAPNVWEDAYDPPFPTNTETSLEDTTASSPILEPQHSSLDQNYTLSPVVDVNSISHSLQTVDLVDEALLDPPPVGKIISTRKPHKESEKNTLGGRDDFYKRHGQHEFQSGKVLVMNWVEPRGDNAGGSKGSHTVITTEYKGDHHAKPRRFLIVNAFKGHCICLPINTYLRQGVTKNGVHADHHTIIYTEYPPHYITGEREKGLNREPILMVPNNPSYKLDSASRLNYAKIYTIEYNVKVKFIGKIHPDWGYQVAADYNSLHPQMIPFKNSTNPALRDTNYHGGSTSRYDGSQDAGYRGSGPGYGATSSFSTMNDSNSAYNTSSRSSQPSSYTQQPRTTGYSVPYSTSATQGGQQAPTYSGYTLTNTSSLYPRVPVADAEPDNTQQSHDGGPSSSHTATYDHHDDIYDADY